MKDFFKKTTALQWVCYLELALMFYGFCDAFKWNLGAVIAAAAVVLFTGTIINLSQYPGLEKLAKSGFGLVVALNVLLLWTHVRNFSHLLDGDAFLPGNLGGGFWGFYTAIIVFMVNVGALYFSGRITAAKHALAQKQAAEESAQRQAANQAEVERALALERAAERNRQAELEAAKIKAQTEREKLQAETERLKILKQHEAEQAERQRQFTEKQAIREESERNRQKEAAEEKRNQTSFRSVSFRGETEPIGTITVAEWRSMTEAQKRLAVRQAEEKIGTGATNKQVSKLLGISERTIQDLRKAA